MISNHKDDLGNRMKEYENVSRFYLTRRLPIIIRIDGTHFHTFTKGLEKPFDIELTNAFWDMTKELTKEIPGCKLAYHQSDEVSFLITDFDKLTTSAWFDKNLQKLVSVSSSMASAWFNRFFKTEGKGKKPAFFDSRVFVLPINEVVNYFIWRQNDATKNSVSMVAQHHFSHKSLQGLKSAQMQERLFSEKGINWNDLPVWQKRGVCIVKQTYEKEGATRHRWEVDKETPIFTKDREYIEKFLQTENK